MTKPGDDKTTSTNDEPTGPSRRRFLGMLAGTAGAAAAAGAVYVASNDPSPSNPSAGPSPTNADGSPADPTTVPASPTTTNNVPGRTTDRTLVVVELNGGNDGLATLVPYSNDRLAEFRPRLTPSESELILIDDDYAITSALEKNWAQGMALVQGVGLPNGSGSHFEMERRWWSGTDMGRELETTGFLGRLCDELDRGDPITGLSLGTRRSPAMLSAKPVTAGLTNPGVSWWTQQQNAWFTNLRSGIAAMAIDAPADTSTVQTARDGLSSALDFAGVLSGVRVDDATNRYPGTALGWQFAIAAEVIGADAGVRVIHITHGNFDTHDDQSGTHKHLLRQLDDALSVFRDDLAQRGRTDQVLIATTSEFGRRPQQSGTGTDHGAASMAMMAGPVLNGRFGEHPSLKKLDDNDNLVPTLSMAEYYTTIAEGWLEVPASLVLSKPPPVVPGILDT